MIDSITVVFEPEIHMLRAQAFSMDRYWQSQGKINVVVNDRPQLIEEIDPSWWGRHRDRVKIYHYSKWYNQLNLDGWVTQQILKLLACASSNSEWGLVLDAKTLFVNDFHPSQYQDQHGRINVSILETKSVFDHSRDIVQRLFNITLQGVAGPGGVPHWIHCESVRQLCNFFTERNDSLIKFWERNGMLTEFMLYAGWIQNKHRDLKHFYSGQQEFSVVNIAHNEIDLFENKLQEMQSKSTLTVSIHRAAWNDYLTEKQKTKFNEYLANRGLVSYDHMW